MSPKIRNYRNIREAQLEILADAKLQESVDVLMCGSGVHSPFSFEDPGCTGCAVVVTVGRLGTAMRSSCANAEEQKNGASTNEKKPNVHRAMAGADAVSEAGMFRKF